MPELLADRVADEGTLNRSLRRVDWRFLLPTGPPVHVACFADGELAEATRLTFGDGQGDRSGVGPDLVVLAEADADTLANAFRTVRPGGACYAEWRGVRPGPRGAHTRLREAGFTDVACYWPWPDPRRATPRYWVPFHAVASSRRFLDSRPSRRGVFGRTTRRILVVLSLLALRIGLLRPICAVARRPGDEPGESVLDLVREQHERGTSTRGDGLSLLLFTPGVSPLNKVLGYVLADREVRPRFVVKLGRVDQAEQALMQEAATLEAIETTRPLAGAPSVVFLDHRHRTVLAETFLDGTPLTTMLSPTRHLELALKATDWLVDLAAGRPPEARDRWWSRLVEGPLEETLPVVEPELSASGVRHLRERLACLADLPLVPEQRDCAPWNILLDDRGDLVVHDWESAEPEGLPYLDLAYFLSYSAFLLDGALESGRLSASYRASLDPSTPAGAVNAACTDRYVNRLGLDPLVLPALRSLTWVVHLRSTCARLGAARGRQSPFVSLLREELHTS